MYQWDREHNVIWNITFIEVIIMSIISNSIYVSEITNIGGEYMTLFVFAILIMSLLLINTKYDNRYVSNLFDTIVSPLLLTFLVIIISKISHII